MTLESLRLLRLHVEAVWSLTLPELVPSDTILTPETPLPPWSLYLAHLDDTTAVRLWRPGVPADARAALLSRARHALDDPASSDPGVTRELALAFANSPPPARTPARGRARRLAEPGIPILAAFDAEWASYTWDGSRSPIVGIFAGGLLVCVAHSARRTAHACELGIDTLPAFRRHGRALCATRLWTAAILAEGLIPLYSALADNAPSLALAHAAGYRPFARAAYVHEGMDIP